MIAVIVLALVGLAFAAYQAKARISYGALCITGNSCNAVTNSTYSSLFGIPVALIGLLGFVLLIAATAYAYAVNDKKALKPLLLISTAGLAFVSYLIYLEVTVLHAICSICTVSHVIGIAIWILVVFSLWKY